MATYAIGDIQGCSRTLERLLDRISPASADRLWFVGDLVNRGRGSADVLRWLVKQGDRVTAVLGNHDLHLLGCRAGTRKVKGKDTIHDVLEAPDRDDLLDWVAARPFLVRGRVERRSAGHESSLDPLTAARSRPATEEVLLVHAGLLPAWTATQAASLADEATTALRTDRQGTLELIAAADPPDAWRRDLTASDRLRLTIGAMTRLRCCKADGSLDAEFSGPPREAPEGLLPWFDVPERKSRDVTIVFGHWAALGLVLSQGIVGTDTGCVWGYQLTAVRLEDRAVFQERAHPKDIAR